MGFPKINYQWVWADEVEKSEKALKENPEQRFSGQGSGQEYRQALGRYKLACFAERLRNGNIAIWNHPSQADILHLYLINKHHWTLEQARQIQKEDEILLLLRNELEQLKLNEAEADPVKNSVSFLPDYLDFAAHFEPT
ncbi:hypothetical protein PSE10C_13340 [Pseudomonas amygdali pv. eriobotryae]|nr:hypothetical protein AL052_05370 [Pseudomonas amygdali pv. eriobotryae]GFZ70592.1 hypothetical protein PSE10C_13340 [Pseudomonas amygdali pv. eriobotryae]